MTVIRIVYPKPSDTLSIAEVCEDTGLSREHVMRKDHPWQMGRQGASGQGRVARPMGGHLCT